MTAAPPPPVLVEAWKTCACLTVESIMRPMDKMGVSVTS